MIAFIQRVSQAEVHVAAHCVGRIGPGLLALIGVRDGDGPGDVERLAHRLLHYRVFADEHGRMNRDVQQVGGALLLVPQFTLCADTRKGLRPSFSGAANPACAEQCFTALVGALRQADVAVETGQFGADMQVSLTNDGPVSFWLESGSGH